MVTTDDGSRPAGPGERVVPTGRRVARSPAARAPAGSPLVVVTRVRPGASRTAVGGRYDGPHGPAVVVAVPAPAVDGRATEAARQALARALRVRPASVSLRTGAAARDKLFAVADPPADLQDRLRDLRDRTG